MNHFIEIQKTTDDLLAIMVHTGSRNLGKQVCDHYNKAAQNFNAMWYTSVNPKWDLAFLPMDTHIGGNYYQEMKYCLEFAKCNRKLIMSRIQEIFEKWFPNAFHDCSLLDVHHNYAQFENHFGKDVLVHRKGAVLARDNAVIIPGSQGTSSYIGRGLSNPESFNSCSHGSGRLMGRNQARRTLHLKDEIAMMDDQGIVHGIRTVQDLDEAPSAYKNIDDVMKNQTDLVTPIMQLKPLAVIKG